MFKIQSFLDAFKNLGNRNVLSPLIVLCFGLIVACLMSSDKDSVVSWILSVSVAVVQECPIASKNQPCLMFWINSSLPDEF